MLKTVFLADLVYDTIKTNYVVPLNIAYIAACLEKNYGRELDIRLFKYPTELEKALREQHPDVLGLSNYSWNSRLNNVFLDLAKRLNPNALTVMGGPDIRTSPEGVKAFLEKRPSLDYYILYEGEEPFSALIGAILGGERRPAVDGCATLIDNELRYAAIEFKKKSRTIDLPSPYLTGRLDAFLADRNIIPLLETNRGCPFGCVYCAWGIAALSAVRTRPLEVVLEEIDYIAEKSVGQPLWIVCDANYGILERDVVIAEKLRSVVDRKGAPSTFQMWHAKNSSERNIRIANILGADSANYAIQSADPVVLTNAGRGNVSTESIRKQLAHAKSKGVDVGTDVLIGLPGETAESHLKTLAAAFDFGFDMVSPYNIRLLAGSDYETDAYREKYGVVTKYRPIFGCYGVYDGKIVMEVEESLRATSAMSEPELNDFKVHHWLIYFAWNMSFYKPLLRYGLRHGANPALVFDAVSRSTDPLLKETFAAMRKLAMDEWFDSADKMLAFYERPEAYQSLLDSFVKLNFLYIAQVYRDPRVLTALRREIVETIRGAVPATAADPKFMDSLAALSDDLVCGDPLEGTFNAKKSYPGAAVAVVVNDPELEKRERVTVEIYRPENYVAACRFYLMPNGKPDLSVKNFVRFLETSTYTLRNKIRVEK